MTVSRSSGSTVARKDVSLKVLCLSAAALLLAGGVLLDMNRIMGVRETLDRVAKLAATEAMAASRPADRQHICAKRLSKSIWTNTEVSLEDFAVTVDDTSRTRTATVSYDFSINLVVGRFFGIDEVTISSEVEAQAATPATPAAPESPAVVASLP